jgi:hypothetical protein
MDTVVIDATEATIVDTSKAVTTVFSVSVPNSFRIKIIDQKTKVEYKTATFEITTVPGQTSFNLEARVNCMDRQTDMCYFTASPHLSKRGPEIPVAPTVNLFLCRWGEGSLTTFILCHE